jgi:hypothetical protein
MGCGTLLIALVPGYQTIGVLAPILVLVGRLLQGRRWDASGSPSQIPQR